MRELRKDRFPRPLITWDIWNEEPPHKFPLHANANEDDTNKDETNEDEIIGETPLELRYARLANQVSHMLNPKNDSKKGAHNARLEEWA